jgi:hypothetical protein
MRWLLRPSKRLGLNLLGVWLIVYGLSVLFPSAGSHALIQILLPGLAIVAGVLILMDR